MTIKHVGLIVGGVIVLGIAYYLLSPIWRTVRVDDALPVQPPVAAVPNLLMPETETQPQQLVPAPEQPTIKPLEGTFVPGAHDVSGKVIILPNDDGDILRFEDFETINGPDLRIYLATDKSATDIVDLGSIRGTTGNINYTLPTGTDTTKYKYVLVWCRAFHVLFSSALLQ
ncbi:MAG: DM13 domain-containing protein [Patescibacteria group bacterium]